MPEERISSGSCFDDLNESCDPMHLSWSKWKVTIVSTPTSSAKVRIAVVWWLFSEMDTRSFNHHDAIYHRAPHTVFFESYQAGCWRCKKTETLASGFFRLTLAAALFSIYGRKILAQGHIRRSELSLFNRGRYQIQLGSIGLEWKAHLI